MQHPDITKIKHVVCLHYGVTLEEINSRCRRRPVVQARQVAMYLIRMCTDITLWGIAKAFNRTHNAVVNAMRVIRKDLELMTVAANLRKLCDL